MFEDLNVWMFECLRLWIAGLNGTDYNVILQLLSVWKTAQFKIKLLLYNITFFFKMSLSWLLRVS
jgi:hypothetical protein